MAHQKAVPTLAAIDAWTCYGRRTELSDGRKSLPDAFAVADQTMVRGLADDGLGAVRVHEVGQPHLQALGERLGRRRTPRRSKRLLLAFFSEGIREAQPGPKSPGYDQFTVAELLIGALSGLGPIDLHIVPHPLEEAANWREFLSPFPLGRDLSLVSGSLGRDDALCTADGILGMTSMVLVEAALVGAPFLSLQPGRTRSANPFLDSLAGVLVVTDAASTATAVSTFIQRLESQITPLQIPATDNAIRRFAAAVEAELRGSAHLVVQLATS
jgi:hypothetical protein